MSLGKWALAAILSFTVIFFALGLNRGRFDNEITFTAAVQTGIILAAVAVGQALRSRDRR